MKSPEIINVVGLGYVGLPVAVAFSKNVKTFGIDINVERVEELRRGVDRTNEVESEELKACPIHYSTDIKDAREATFHIVTVPTPIDQVNRPNLKAIVEASRAVAKILKQGDVVVYESTVYPGVTREVCIPILEGDSGLTCGKDFSVGYSPERINPGDKEHRFETILKVVSGFDQTTLDRVADVYGSVVTAGVFKAATLEAAEAAKVIENTQRDLNVALVNELALIFDRLGIDTRDVLDAAATKWNFLKFEPGLVGGHCIGVDPYYLTHRAEQVGYNPQVILAGRRINNDVGKFIAQKTIKQLAHAGVPLKGARAILMGATFKEDCPDIRNSRSFDIVHELKDYGLEVEIADARADAKEVHEETGLRLTPIEELKPADAIVLAVKHKAYREMSPADYLKLLKPSKIIMDVKGVLSRGAFQEAGIKLWRL